MSIPCPKGACNLLPSYEEAMEADQMVETRAEKPDKGRKREGLSVDAQKYNQELINQHKAFLKNKKPPPINMNFTDGATIGYHF